MSFDVIYSTISYNKIVCTRRLKEKGKPLSLARFSTRLYFVAHSSLNETKYVFFFAFVGPMFSAVMMLKKIKGVKIHGDD